MAIGDDGGSKGRGGDSMRRAIGGLAAAAVEGLHAPDEDLSREQQRRARGLTERMSAEVQQLAERELRRDPRSEPTVRDAIAAATTLFEEHPLSARALVALDLEPARAVERLVGEGEAMAAVEPAAAEMAREQILPHVAQQLLNERSLITELVSRAAAAPQVTVGLLLTIDGHIGAVASAEISPDGGTILTASEDATARLWNAADGQEQAALRAHEMPLWRAAYSRDGSQIATASHDHTARLWNPGGQQLQVLEGHEDWVRTAAFSSDGSRVVTASYDGTARVWDVATGAQLLSLQHDNQVADAAFSPDDSRIITGCYDTQARIWDAASGQEQLVLQGHGSEVVSVAFSPDGARIITGSHDQTARIWNAADGQLLLTLTGHTAQVRSARFSPDGSMVVTASDDRSARLWASASGQQAASLEGHTDWVFFADFGPDGNRIVTASSDGTARLWSCSVAQEVVVGRNGRVPIPRAFREALGIEPGDPVLVELGQGELRVRPQA